MSAIKILIADDETRMRKLLSDFLKREGFSIIEAQNGRLALDLFYNSEPFDLVILDVMMPELNGWEVCKEIRKTSSVPIIILTAKAEESSELMGFDIGADEFITKPFSPMVLVARVQALLRRSGKIKRSSRVYDSLKIDEAGRNVFVNDSKLELSPKEFELLLYLSDNEGIALSRDQILNFVWSYDYFGDGRTVDTHIKKIRLKLGEKCDYIQTVRGLGYKFEVAK